ncbi:hypothetical protein BT63DRAFT_418367 [Microthyrium microscopicum]|uniref:feruloyl esterase n=1 Tax=Microthyrium microscopicum TaxID=703497 RepID=A0A6A6TY26_9PEZI|nr:hypothetical protein BT63DRAFT_418367 [Microthyrium microscopicum]
MRSLLSTFLAISSISYLTAAQPSQACTGEGVKAVEWAVKPGEVKVFRVNDRVVRVTVPEAYTQSKPAPMIIAFHDREQPPEHLEYETAFGDEKVNPSAIMVYPTAENDRWLSDFGKLQKLGTQSENYTADIDFIRYLVRDLDSMICIDTSRIYAAGLGTGGGMMHLLACDKELSTKFAAFAAVGGGFGRAKAGVAPWGVCSTERTNTPIMEIHGKDDRIFGYYLTEGENGKIRTIPQHWIEDWAERNGCGEKDGDAVQSTSDPRTWITKLDNGVMTETVQYGGSAIRVARRCFGADGEDKTVADAALGDAKSDVLHYQIAHYGHGWPRLQLKKAKSIIFHDTEIELEEGTQFFDTSKVMIDFFMAHKLPKEYLVSASGPTDEELEKQMRAMLKQKAGGIEISDAEIKERVQELKKAMGDMKNKPAGEVVDEDEKDEL